MTLEMEEDAAQKALLVHEKEGTATLDGLLAEIGFNGYQWVLYPLHSGHFPEDLVSSVANSVSFCSVALGM